MIDQRAEAPADAPVPEAPVEARSVVVACGDDDGREVLARVAEAAGLRAVRLDAELDVAEAVVAGGADAVVLDLGAANLEVLARLRARPDDAAQAARVVVVGTGPAGGRLAWQAGADAFLARPFHARDLQAALHDALAVRDGDDRLARRSAGAATP